MRFGWIAAAALAAPLFAGVSFAQGPSDPTGAPTTPAPAPQGPSIGVDSSGTLQAPIPGAKATTTNPDTTTETPNPEAASEETKLIWRGSNLIADQSVSAETVGVGREYQTYNPSYQIWLSFRPQVHVYSDAVQDLSVQGRADYYKTLTNGEELSNGHDSTTYREDVFGDVWLTLRYNRKLYNQNGWTTAVNAGPRVLLPTSKVSQAAGVIASGGLVAGVTQTFPLNRRSDWFHEGHISYSASFSHTFAKDTTAASSDFSQFRTNVDGRTFQDFQLSGTYLTDYSLMHIIDAGVQITPKLGLGATAVLIEKWRYAPTNGGAPGCDNGIGITIQNAQTCATAGSGVGDPTRYSVSTWLTAAVDYQVLQALNVAFGYYNYANQLAPDGTRQSAFFAPESARFFLTATVGLDELYESIRGERVDGKATRPNRVTKSSPLGVTF